jgi:hypothetical protein
MEGGDSSVARQAILELAERLARKSSKTDAEIALEFDRGSELVKARWIRDRLLVDSIDLETAWGRSRQDLRDACEQGELFSLQISGHRWYPAAFLTVPIEDVAAVCGVLRGLDASSQFLFWHHKHGSLKGQTLHAALRAGQRQAVLHVARTFATETFGA